SEIVSVVEPCIRQSILFSLLPADALDTSDPNVNIDNKIEEHLAELGLELSAPEQEVLRDICINYRKLMGLNRSGVQARTMTLGAKKAPRVDYERIRKRQKERCLWWGVPLDPPAYETLEHVAPKHIGDDPGSTRNWGLSCKTCNEGKSDVLAWAASP